MRDVFVTHTNTTNATNTADNAIFAITTSGIARGHQRAGLAARHITPTIKKGEAELHGQSE